MRMTLRSGNTQRRLEAEGLTVSLVGLHFAEPRIVRHHLCPRFRGQSLTWSRRLIQSYLLGAALGERVGVSDEEWALIGPLLPPERGRGCRPALDNRRYFEGMMGIARTGGNGVICPMSMANGTASLGAIDDGLRPACSMPRSLWARNVGRTGRARHRRRHDR
jgi:hypothetical protein